MKEISVVIPTKDRLFYLRKCVPMFLSLEEVKEVIIVVDGCRDGTLDYVKAASEADPRVRYTDNGVNRGLCYSRNRGIDLASGEYIFTAEDDLTLSAGFFSVLLAHLKETGADVIAGRNIFYSDHESMDEALQRANKLTGSFVDMREIGLHTGMRTSADQEQLLLPAPMLARSHIFRKIRYDVRYVNNSWREESDFQLSARAAGYKLVFCPHAVSFNLVITNDRSGVHASVGARRVKYLVLNNWRFIRKHRSMIARDFNIGNPYAYMVMFTLSRVSIDIINPMLGRTRRMAMRMFRIAE
jgi:glycosyltransferase involved in cell wall biosynthesis